MSWLLVKFKDCCKVVGGATPKRNVEANWSSRDVPWVTPKDISKHTDKTLLDAPEYISQQSFDSCATYLLPKGSVLLTSRAPIGNVAIAGREMCTNQGFKSLVPGKDVDTVYLYYCLLYFSQKLQDLGNGATFKEVSKKVVEEFEVPLPPLPEQKRIAAILDKADQLRQKRQQAIGLADEFLRSVFLDMFGDLAFNPHNFEKHSIESLSVTDGVKCGPFGTQLGKHEFMENGVPLWGIKHVNKDFKLPTHEFLTKEKAEELRTYSILPNDIVMTRKGTVGNCHVYPDSLEPGIMHSDLLRIRIDESRMDPYFLSWQLKLSRDVIHQISLISSGAIMAGINVGKLKKIDVCVPSLEKQTKVCRGH